MCASFSSVAALSPVKRNSEELSAYVTVLRYSTRASFWTSDGDRHAWPRRVQGVCRVCGAKRKAKRIPHCPSVRTVVAQHLRACRAPRACCATRGGHRKRSRQIQTDFLKGITLGRLEPLLLWIPQLPESSSEASVRGRRSLAHRRSLRLPRLKKAKPWLA